MRNILRTGLVSLLIISILAGPVSAQITPKQLTAIILQHDSLFWNTYNTCDLAGMRKFFTDDAEFYHDKGGITLGGDNLVASIKNGLCASSNYHLRREVVPGTVKVYPMQKNDSIYAAIMTGEHYFYITADGKPEYLDGQANFSHLWILKDGEWRMSRVLSYNHHPGYINKRTETPISPKALDRYTGKFKSAQVPAVSVELKNGSLVLVIDDNNFFLFHEKNDLFFVKDRDLTFEFISNPKGVVTGIRVREKGQVVDELTKILDK